MFNENAIKFAVFQLDIPFPVDLKDSTERDDQGRPYPVLIGNVIAEIRTKRRFHEDIADNCKIAPAKIAVDRFGKLSHTRIQVWFHRDALEAYGFNIEELYNLALPALPLALFYVNKFLQTYKLATKEYWIPAITKDDVLGYSCSFIDEQGESSQSFVPICQTTHGSGGEPFCISNEKENDLRAALASNHVNLQLLMNLAAIDHYTKGNFNLAIIECAILFENIVYSTLKQRLSNTKLKKLKQKEDCGCHVGIYEVCVRGIQEVYGFDFGSTQEFLNFKDRVITMRNKIVHGDQLEEVSSKQCEDALEATKTIIELFNKTISEYKPLED